MLPNINLLYLFCGVLILQDLTYMGRFWVRRATLHRSVRLSRELTCPRV